MRVLTAMFFLALVVPAVGASAEELFMGNTAEAVQQARKWQHAGDVASARGELAIAHLYYQKVATVFPGTPHGQWAEVRMKMIEAQLRQPQESPAHESWETWKREMREFFAWP